MFKICLSSPRTNGLRFVGRHLFFLSYPLPFQNDSGEWYVTQAAFTRFIETRRMDTVIGREGLQFSILEYNYWSSLNHIFQKGSLRTFDYHLGLMKVRRNAEDEERAFLHRTGVVNRNYRMCLPDSRCFSCVHFHSASYRDSPEKRDGSHERALQVVCRITWETEACIVSFFRSYLANFPQSRLHPASKARGSRAGTGVGFTTLSHWDICPCCGAIAEVITCFSAHYSEW